MPKIIRPPYRKGRNKCIFCEGTTKISKEYIVGDRLKEYFPRDKKTAHTAAHISWPKNVISEKPIDARRRRPGHSGSIKLRVVCQNCNSRWRSGLENWAKDVLPPLMSGQRCNLLPEGQAKLATWAVKTSMVAANFKPRETSMPQEERTSLMQKLIPPNNWFVWISVYEGGVWSPLTIFQDRGSLSPTPVPDAYSAPYYIQATTFGVGHILFLVLSSSHPDIRGWFAGKEAEGFLQIWPPQPRSILWPLKRVLNTADANYLANTLRTSGVFDHAFDRAGNWTFTF